MPKTTKLKNLATIRSGYTFRGSIPIIADGTLGVVQAKDVRGSLYISDGTIGRISDTTSVPLTSSDVLLTSRGSFRASACRFREPAIAASSLYVIRLATDNFIPEYIAIYLNSDLVQAYFWQNAKGATIKSILIDDLRNLEVPNLPIQEQATLVELYGNVERQHQLLDRKLSIIQQILKASITRKIQGANR